MSLFTPDLYRHLSYGFIAGALLVGAANADQWASKIESPANAASPLAAPQVSDEFRILAVELGE